MKTALVNIARTVPTLIEHTTMNLSLSMSGWPAATAVIGLCGTAIAITAIIVGHGRVQEVHPS